MRVRDNCSLKNSSNLFSYPRFPLPSPFRPLTEKEEEEEEEEEEEIKSKDKFNCVEFRFQISRRSIRKVQISQSNTCALLSLEVSGKLPWQWLLLSLNTLTHFLC